MSALAQITPATTPTRSPLHPPSILVPNYSGSGECGSNHLVRFDLSGIPPSVTVRCRKATLKIYVSTVTTAGSFNVDLVTVRDGEHDYREQRAHSRRAIASAVPVTTADKNKYVLVMSRKPLWTG